MRHKRNQKIGNVLLVLLFVGTLFYLLVSGVSDLINKEDLYTITIDGAAEVLEVEHSINGLIPLGTDHYYVGIEEETNQAYLLKASKRWFQKNFGEDHMALNPNGLTITALAKRVSNYGTDSELQNRLSQLGELRFPMGMSGYSLNIGYKTTAALKLFALLFILVLTKTGMPIFKDWRKEQAKDKVKKENKFLLNAGLPLIEVEEQKEADPTYVKIWCSAALVCVMILILIFR